MVRSLVLLLSTAALAAAADNPWDKVKELKSGAEIRISKRGVAQPIEARLDEVRDDAVVFVVKNEQMAVAKEEIDRLDARPKQSASRISTETKRTTTTQDARPISKPTERPSIPGQTYSSGVNITSKPGYETVYRRPAPRPANAPAAEKK